MSAFVRGEPINLPAKFWVIDPITKAPVLTDPTTVTFTVLAPDGTETEYVFGVDSNVTNPSVGVFVCALSPQLPVGVYHANIVGTGAVEVQSPDEEFTVYESAIDVPAPPPLPVEGPCSQWISGPDLAVKMGLAYETSPDRFDTAAFDATIAMYEISGRQFPGICERKVRPPRIQSCACWLTGPVSYGMGPWYWTTTPWGFGGWGWYNEQGDKFGCAPMSRIKLAGTAHEIVEVKLDGVVMPEFDPVTHARNWRLDKWRYLTRMDDPSVSPAQPRFWPGCQNMSLDDDQPGTLSVKYKWGVDVPQLGRDAALEIAEQLYVAFGGDDCLLPAGVTRVDRQGIVVERGLLQNWAVAGKAVGLVHVDLFLQAYCAGQRRGRKSSVWSPDVTGYGVRVGINE